MKLLITALMLLFALPTVSQIEATTKEGKKVLLYKNGTWKYAKAKTTTATPGTAVVAVPVVATATVLPEDLKKEALEFSLQIVNTYFTQDCSSYGNYLSAEVITMKSVLPLTAELKSKACESLQRAVSDKSKTLQDYLSNYKVEMLTRAEVEAKFGMKLPEYYNTTDAEFIFLGFEPNEGSGTTKYIWDDMFAFLVRKTDGAWKMKGTFD